MSVFLDNHRRGSDYETDAPFGRSNVRRNHSNGRPMKPRRRDEAPLWGFSYDRAESAIHLLLAFIMVGGVAAMLWNFVAPEAEKPAAPVRTALPAPAKPQTAPEKTAVAPPIAKVENPAPVETVPPPPVKPAAPPLTAAVLSPTPIANAPAPLPPPPVELREKLAAPVEAPAAVAAKAPEPQPAPVAEQAEASPPEAAATEAKADAVEGNSVRTAHCYVKLGGRVETNASCRVEITDNGIIFRLPGKPLEITHEHGRTWNATLGGRSLGKVYKSGSCWGSRGFYACKKG